MSYVLEANVTIGGIKVDYITQLSLVSSWKILSDVGRIVVPRKVKVKYEGDGGDLIRKDITEVFKSGDRVRMDLSYKGFSPTTEFVGYVRSIGTGAPLVFEVEDSMYLLKRNKVSFSSTNCKLSKIIEAVNTPGFEVKVVDAEIGSFRASNVSGHNVLQELKKYGIHSYFRGEVLHVGFAYSFYYATVKYDFDRNIKMGQRVLNYRRQGELNTSVTAISIRPDGTQIKVDLGEGKNRRTMHFYNIGTKAELKKIAEAELGLLDGAGYYGSFLTLGRPVVRHGDVANIFDALHPERTGQYFVDKVITKWGVQSGYEREVFMGKAAAV